MTRIVVSGILGRMGKRIAALTRQESGLEVVAGLELNENPGENIFNDLSKVKASYDCVIEFTTPKATMEHLDAAKKLKKSMVIGTTGLSDAEIERIREASRSMPIVFSPNMSVGVNVFFSLIEKAAASLGSGYEARIKEAHHVHKKDKPSGTSKLMAQIIKEKMKGAAAPVESMREGEIIGDHEIILESDVDIVKISHSAKTRDIFALGALRAARFVSKKKNGLFTMYNVLGLEACLPAGREKNEF